jgi:hypothetical protein
VAGLLDQGLAGKFGLDRQASAAVALAVSGYGNKQRERAIRTTMALKEVQESAAPMMFEVALQRMFAAEQREWRGLARSVATAGNYTDKVWGLVAMVMMALDDSDLQAVMKLSVDDDPQIREGATYIYRVYQWVQQSSASLGQ